MPHKISTTASLFATLACGALQVFAASISGEVIEDHTGSPLASANVQVSQPGERFLAADLETDREGRFAAANLPAGHYHLRIRKPGYQNSELDIDVSDGGEAGTVPRLRLVRLGVISGSVRDANGGPVTGARVFALPKPPGNQALRPPVRAGTHAASVDPDGNYRIYNLPPGEYVIAATWGASTFAIGSSGMIGTKAALGSGRLFYPSNARPDFLAVSGGTEYRNINFTVTPQQTFSVSGTVLNPEERTEYWMALLDPEQPALSIAVAATDFNNGSFTFQGIPAGTYELVGAKTAGARNSFGALLAEDPVFVRTRVVVAGADVAGLAVAFEQMRTATFLLETAQGCPASATLELNGLEDWGSNFTRQITVTAGQPEEVAGLAPLRYLVSMANASSQDCFLETDRIVDLGDGDAEATLRLEAPGSVEGSVSGQDGPEAYQIVLASLNQPITALNNEGELLFTTPAADAHFAFENLPPGRYRIGAYPANRPVPAITDLTEFELRGGASVEIDLAAIENQ